MSKIILRQINLYRWFPPNDRFAACIARLRILREDFALEMSGMYHRKIKTLDAHSSMWRRLYFWRNLVRMLSEIRKALETPNTVAEFKQALKKQPDKWQKKFASMVGRLAEAEALETEVRNSLGGHVLQKSVEKALDNMSPGKWSYLEMGRTEGMTHYIFAGELVGEILLAGIPEEKRIKELERQFRAVSKLMPVFELTGILLTIYVSARKLHE